jgi:hypothetical protein
VRRLRSSSVPWPSLPVCARLIGLLLAALLAAHAQQTPPAAGAPETQPEPQSVEPKTKIQVNLLNSCRPSPADVEEIGRALARVRERPKFSTDFEISRGLTTLTEAEARAAGVHTETGLTPSQWVRIRREFPDKAALTDVQYSLSAERGSASEVLALHLRDSREVLQVLISDAVAGSAAQVVMADTLPERIRIERFGKSSIVLARCSAVDQSAYEPLFRTAGEIFQSYRKAMAVKTVIPAELAHLPDGTDARGKAFKAAGVKH